MDRAVNKLDRRTIFNSWDNMTPFEKDFVKQMKDLLLSKYGIDFDQVKQFGPRREKGGQCEIEEIVKKRDKFLDDRQLLRFACARFFKLEHITEVFAQHMCWRE